MNVRKRMLMDIDLLDACAYIHIKNRKITNHFEIYQRYQTLHLKVVRN